MINSQVYTNTVSNRCSLSTHSVWCVCVLQRALKQPSFIPVIVFGSCLFMYSLLLYILRQGLTLQFHVVSDSWFPCLCHLSAGGVGINHHTLFSSLLPLLEVPCGSTMDFPFTVDLRKSVTTAVESPQLCGFCFAYLSMEKRCGLLFLNPCLQFSSSKCNEQYPRNFFHQGWATPVDFYYKHLPTCVFLFWFDF